MSRDLTNWAAEHAGALAARAAMGRHHTIEAPGLLWMALHGTICLGLRHPEFTGPPREMVISFARELGKCLVEWGVLTAEELEVVQNVERQESPHGRE